MALISFDKNAVIDFIPEYSGNRDALDPCVVKLRYVPFSKVQHYSRLISNKIRENKSSNPSTAAHEVQRQQFVENVQAIRGFWVDGKEITDPGEFYEVADFDLIMELLRAMESSSKLSAGQRKN